MKIIKSIVFSGLMLLGTIVNAGKLPEYKKVYESAFPFAANLYADANPAGDKILGTTEGQICLLDGNNGKLLWHHKFKDLSGGEITRSNFHLVLWDANILLVFDNKVGMDRVAAFDLADKGKMLWIKDKYKWPKPGKEGNKAAIGDMVIYIKEAQAFAFTQKESLTLIKAKTGEEVWETSKFKGSIGTYFYDNGDLVMLNYKPSGLAALFSGFKNQLVRINSRNGEVKWETTYRGVVRKKILTKEAMVSMKQVGDKIFLVLNGLQTFNTKTGQPIWHATYTYNLDARKGWVKAHVQGRVHSAGVYGAYPEEPLVVGNSVYTVLGDDKMKTKYVQKRDLQTGKVIWTSEKIKGAGAMPAIHKVSNRIVAQVGGFVNIQAISTVKTTGSDGKVTYTTVRTNKMVPIPKFGLVGIDDSNGAFIWRSEKFKKNISNITVSGKNVYAASALSFYNFDAASGKVNYEIPVKAAKVGKAIFTLDAGDAVAVICRKGISAYNKQSGKLKYAARTFNGIESYVGKGKNIFLQNKKFDVACIDFNDGTTIGAVNAKSSSFSKNLKFEAMSEFTGGVDMSEDGEYVFTFRKKKIVKYKVN